MTMMLAKVYAALKAAGAPDDEAMAAAEEIGDLRDEFGGLRNAVLESQAETRLEISALRSDFKGGLGDVRNEIGAVRAEIAYLRGRFDVLIWAVGINAAATVAILGVLLRH